jgi:hypothetical protein
MRERKTEFKVSGEELLGKIKKLLHEGNIRRIITKDEKGSVFMEIPVAVGIVGAAFLPVFAAVSALAALVNNFTIEVVKKDNDETEK